MRVSPFVRSALATALFALGMASAQAEVGVYYDPSNVASPTGKTIGWELFGTIGCPGKALFDTPCPMPPKDGDGDGVTDDKDQCPTTPAGRKVDAKGCEIDTDGDGIVDGDDRCPTVFAKTPDGCPVPAPAPVPVPAPEVTPAPAPLSLEGVHFDNDRGVIRSADKGILDAAAETLQKQGDTKVEVAGYTDDRGDAAYNQKLSQRRAEAVRQYLIDKGIDASRLTAKGYGESNPVADNGTAEGRFKNRRVELVPQ